MSGYARTSAFSILLVRTATPISLLIFRCHLVGREIFFSQTVFMLTMFHNYRRRI